jgi:hypothetical protein
MIPQVIDAMGDMGDCQREHLYRKPLSDCVIGWMSDLKPLKMCLGLQLLNA